MVVVLGGRVVFDKGSLRELQLIDSGRQAGASVSDANSMTPRGVKGDLVAAAFFITTTG